MPTPELLQSISRLLRQQRLACLATQREQSTYCNLIAFTPTDDLKNIFFATPRATTKYRNLACNPLVSIMIDNRSTLGTDFTAGMAVTALGRAQETLAQEETACKKIHAHRHANLAGFINTPDCALFKLQVEQYIIVRNVDEVSALDVTKMNRQITRPPPLC